MQINGAWRDVYKQPITDSGKHSKPGRLAVIRDAGVLKTMREDALSWESNLLRPVFRNGELLVDDSFDAIRARSNQH